MKKKGIKRFMLSMLVMTLCQSLVIAKTAASLSIEKFSINAGETKEMLIDLNNPDDEITLVQFDLSLPTGLSIAAENGELAVDIAGRTTWKKHSLSTNQLNGVTRFLLSSQTNATLSGSSGAIISVKIVAASGFNGGDIKLQEQLLVTPNAEETKPAEYTFKIEGAPKDDVTLTAKSYSRAYGDPNPMFEYTVTNGSITSGSPKITCVATATSPVGTYDIVIEKGSVSNSTVNLVKGTLTITKASLTVSAGNYTKVEGEENPSFKATYTGFKNGETEAALTKKPTIITTATKDSPAGTYPVTVSGAEAQNYDFTYQSGTLTVTAKPQESNTFTSKTVEGVEMTFTILDEQKKICMVGVDNTDKTWLNAVTAIDNNTTGKLTIPEKANGYVVEKVGDYAFYGCKISEIVLPEGLASIGTFAFANCPITTVTLPSTLTFIGSNAFTKLETIYSYVVDPFELSEKAFNYTNYQVAGGDGTTYYYYTANLYVPKGTKEKYASTPSWNHFMDNGDRIIEMENSEETYKDGDVFGVDVNGIWMVFRVLSAENKTVQIGSSTAENSNTTVDTAVNWETTNGVITIPSEVKGFKVIKIASGAFLKCANITEVIIPETVKSIGNRAFMLSGVSKVTIPEGVENIGDRAFLGSPITSVTLPSTLKFIGQFAFGWDGVAGHDRNDLEEIYCCVKEPFELSEKAFSYNRYIVTSTGEELFRYTGKLYVPSGTKDKYLATPTWNWFTSSNIIEMGQAEDNIQFADSNVKAICVQNWDKDYDGELSKEEAATVKNIGTVFKETQIHMFNELQYFTGLTAIGNNAFRKCQMLTSIILPESIQKIGENAFTDCRELSALEIPATVTEIGQSVFAGCNHLIVTVAQGNKTFVAEDMMLYQKDKYGEQIETLLWCSPMKSGNVTINSAASTLADNCFYECGEIIGVEIPDNVKTLGDGVFVKCSKLENVRIGKGVESIGEGCFNATPKLRQITVYASNPYYAFDGGVLIKRQGNVLVAYPNAKGVQYKVREGIEAIGKWAFYYTNIASVTLPETLSSIEDYAFYDCKNLTEIIINTKMVPEVAAKSFGDVTFEQATLTVPAGMKSQYQTAEVWKNFKNIVEMQDTGINGVGVDDKAFKVYDMNGHKIRSEATSLESLPKGVYIINGRKVVK